MGEVFPIKPIYEEKYIEYDYFDQSICRSLPENPRKTMSQFHHDVPLCMGSLWMKPRWPSTTTKCCYVLILCINFHVVSLKQYFCLRFEYMIEVRICEEIFQMDPKECCFAQKGSRQSKRLSQSATKKTPFFSVIIPLVHYFNTKRKTKKQKQTQLVTRT